MARALPPRHPGLPYIGDTVPLLTNTLAYVAAQRRRYGDLWGTQFIGQRAAVAIGAEAQRQILVNNAQFPAAPGYEFVKPLLGHSLFDMDGDEHTHERRAMTPAFLSSQHAAYLTRLDDILEKALSEWGNIWGTHLLSGRARRDVRVFLCDYHRDRYKPTGQRRRSRFLAPLARHAGRPPQSDTARCRRASLATLTCRAAVA